MSDSLFNNFEAVSSKAWKQKIHADLKGKDYNDTLVWESLEGIHIKPFYHQDQQKQIVLVDTPTSNWNIGQFIAVNEDVKAANEKAIDRLQRGAESILFMLTSTAIDIKDLLVGIPKECKLYMQTEVVDFSFGENILKAISSFPHAKFRIDIIGHLAKHGNWYKNMEEDHKMLLHFLQLSDQTQIFVDTSIYQNAGADIVQQLAYALGHVTEYLEFLDKSNIKQKEISMHVAVAGNYFFEIAKLKALRYLWEQLTPVFAQQPALFISATPSRRNKTLYDYNVNMLRTTTECMSAVLGGANMVYNKAYDSIYHKDNEFGDRIARNQLLILKNEAYFDKVSNPTEGAYYIESLTDQFADKALSLLKEIEASGGFLQQLKKGKIQEKIQEKHLAAAQQVANQEHILVGTNRFENDKDRMKNDLEIDPFLQIKARKTIIVPIVGKRLAEGIEQNRLKNE